jgi:hypothetical protein
VLDQTLDERLPRDPGELGDGARRFARDLRLRLWHEHLDAAADGIADEELLDPERAVDTFRRSAERLDAWHDGGCQGPRPPGRLRVHQPEQLSALRRAWSLPIYRTVYDPDGRPLPLRRAGRW